MATAQQASRHSRARTTSRLALCGAVGISVLVAAGCATSQVEKVRQGSPGEFDYYLLALSWSPQYCLRAKDEFQCGADAHYGLVVHGLWPQFEAGAWPEACAPAGAIPADVVKATLPVMPSERLIKHEWAKHGTCTGLNPAEYFGAIAAQFAKIKAPPALDAPRSEKRATLEALREQFLNANPALTREHVAFNCQKGALSEIKVCLNRGFGPHGCGANVRDSCPDELTIAPVKEAAVRVHFIDVGQGAATLFEFSCAAVLVDTGGECTADPVTHECPTSGRVPSSPADAVEKAPQGEKPSYNGRTALLSYLAAFFERRRDLNRTLKLLVLTHPHIDHSLAVEDIGKQYKIENVVTDGRSTGSGQAGQKWLHDWGNDEAHRDHLRMISSTENIPRDGLTDDVIDPVKCDDVDPDIRVLWGSTKEKPASWNSEAFTNENNHSVVLRVAAGKASFLVTGDLEVQGIRQFLDRYRGGRRLETGVLVVGHHGSTNGTTKELLDAVKPTMAVIEMGPSTRQERWTAWDYGHPRQSAVELLERAVHTKYTRHEAVQVATGQHNFVPFSPKKAIYGTGWGGTVIVSATQDGKYQVKTVVSAPAAPAAGVAAR